MNYNDIDRIVARNFGISNKLIHSKSQEDNIIKARAAAITICRRILDYKFSRLSKIYNKRSHNTSRNAYANCKNMLETDKLFAFRYGKAFAEAMYFNDDFKTRKQKYNLHYRLREKNITVRTKEHTISITPDQECLITGSVQLKKLLKAHKYSIQYSIV